MKNRKAFEKNVVKKMMKIYCEKHHHLKEQELCQSCEKLWVYAERKTDACPWGEKKTFCNQCRGHCYDMSKRYQMKKIMRYSGPRMLLRHPLLALLHMIEPFFTHLKKT